MPSFRNMSRGYCRVAGGGGAGLGGVLTWLRFTPAASEADRVRESVTQRLLPDLLGHPGVASAHLLENVVAPPMTAEQAIRGEDAAVSSVLVITNYAQASVRERCERAAREGSFGAAAMAAAPPMATHSLDYTLTSLAATR
jgi:hypothetical protein